MALISFASLDILSKCGIICSLYGIVTLTPFRFFALMFQALELNFYNQNSYTNYEFKPSFLNLLLK